MKSLFSVPALNLATAGLCAVTATREDIPSWLRLLGAIIVFVNLYIFWLAVEARNRKP